MTDRQTVDESRLSPRARAAVQEAREIAQAYKNQVEMYEDYGAACAVGGAIGGLAGMAAGRIARSGVPGIVMSGLVSRYGQITGLAGVTLGCAAGATAAKLTNRVRDGSEGAPPNTPVVLPSDNAPERGR